MGERRRLGEHERLISSELPFSGTLVLQVLHVTGQFDPVRVERAMAWLQRRHPMLRAHLRYGAPVFRRVPPYVYRQPWFETEGTGPIPVQTTTAPWREVIASELRTRLPRGRVPRLRVTLVAEPERDLTHVVICADHATLDASSVAIFSRQLLEYMADPARLEAEPVPSRGLPPAVDAGLPPSPGRARPPYQPAIRLPRRPVERGQYGTRVISHHLPEHTLAALKRTGRSKGATLHGTMTAAFLLGIGDVFGVREMTCLSSFDLRRVVQPPLPPETYGCFVDMLRTRHDIAGDLWAIARDVSFKLIAAIAKDQEAASMIRLPTHRELAMELLPTLRHRGRIDGLAITTAGESGLGSAYGNHRLLDVTMAASLDVVGPGLIVISLEREGALQVSVCYAAHTLAAADAMAVADRAMAALRMAAE